MCWAELRTCSHLVQAWPTLHTFSKTHLVRNAVYERGSILFSLCMADWPHTGMRTTIIASPTPCANQENSAAWQSSASKLQAVAGTRRRLNMKNCSRKLSVANLTNRIDVEMKKGSVKNMRDKPHNTFMSGPC